MLLKGVKNNFKVFLRLNPALELALLVIVFISIYVSVYYISICAFILMGISGLKRALFVYLPLILGGILVLYLYYGGWLPKGEVSGTARIHIQEVSYQSGFFGSSWVYSGVVQRFSGEKGTFRNLPFKLYRRGKLGPIDAHYDYEVEAVLKKNDTYGYGLKVLPGVSFIPIKKRFSLAQKRYILKKRFKIFLKSKVPFKSAREFLIGISTGDFSNAYLSFTFSRFGLNHLLAISGFHFGLLLLFLNLILRPFLPLKVKTAILILALTFFFLFVGNGPSLARAWIVALIYLLGTLVERPAGSINTLSLSMLAILILDPLMLTHLGFQFSFFVTYAILLYYPKIKKGLVKEGHLKHPIENLILKALALGLSVHLAAIPLTLFYFHKFYLLSVLYNFFVPSIVGLLIIILLSSLIVYPLIPPFANILFYIDGYLTEHLLKFLFWIPTSFDYCIRVPIFPFPLLLAYLIFFLGLGCFNSELQQKEDKLLKFV